MMESSHQARLINVYELAGILTLAPQTIRNQLCTGSFPIPAKKLGRSLRFDLRDVNRYLDNLKTLQTRRNNTD
jgi:predicted DNA-binding transcriptional regulator AlpA